MKKETLYRLIKEVIKESEEPTIDPELKNLLDILQSNYNAFAHLAPMIIAADTPLGQKYGVDRVEESDYMVQIYFKSDEAMESFVRILENAGLKRNKVSVQPQVGHFTAVKQRQSKDPKIFKKMGPRVIFEPTSDYGGEE